MKPFASDDIILIERWSKIAERLENIIDRFEDHRKEQKEENQDIRGHIHSLDKRIQFVESFQAMNKAVTQGKYTLWAQIVLFISASIGFFLQWRTGTK